MSHDWRVMGMWEDGRQFLVVLGDSVEDCRRRLRVAMDEYDAEDMDRLDSLWLERWTREEDDDRPDWRPTELLPLRGLRLLRSIQRRASSLIA